MSRSTWCRRGLLLIVVLSTVLVPIQSSAQSTASISGIVKDADGSVLPGVAVIVKNDTAGTQQEVTTDAEGRYQVTALGAGTYTVSASLSGFKTATAKAISVAPGQPVAIPLVLEIGQLEETVWVMSSSELINTQNGTVAATLNADQLTRMPTPTRNALNAVAFLPGVNTTGTNRDSTINGLPESFLSITLDGVSNNDNFLRNTDGFFASVTPRQDAVEAVSVTLSAAGAQVGGGAGAVTMAFQTRSGGNRFTGSAYEYYRNPAFNSNYVFNEINQHGKNEVKLHTFGARAGGPIVIPGLYDGHNKAFYFVHYEQIRFPNSFTRTRTVFNRRVADGWFRYQVGTETREVNVLKLAAANGQISAKDPTMMKMLGMIDVGHDDHRHAQRADRSALRHLRLAEPGEALRAPADGAPRLQPHRQASAERIVVEHHREADARLPEQRRSAIPGRAEPARLRLEAAADLDVDALRALAEHRQRAARRIDGVRQWLELRLPGKPHLASTIRARSRTPAASPSRRRPIRPTGSRPTARAGARRRPTASTTR